MTPPFRILPPDDKGYPGQTSLDLGYGKALVCRGVGPEVEAVLLATKAQRPTTAS